MTIDTHANRRDFTKLSLSTVVAASVMELNNLAAADPADLPIIDTHQHLWDLVRFKPPWLDGADRKIAAKHDMQDYLAETKGLNIVKAIYMEVDVAPEHQVAEAEYVLDLIASQRWPTVAAVISGRPNSESFGDYISRFKNNAAIKGIRQVLHVPTAAKGLCLEPQFVKSARLLGELGKSLDLCMRPTELADGAGLVEKCPNTKFVVDHCGNADPKAWMAPNRQEAKPNHTVEQWKKGIELLAKRPNTVCKISGIVASAPQNWRPEDLAPAIDFCLDQFGPNRVVFGGDWPVCKLGASFAQWVSALKEIVHSRPLADQKKLFHDNAVVFYKLS